MLTASLLVVTGCLLGAVVAIKYDLLQQSDVNTQHQLAYIPVTLEK